MRRNIEFQPNPRRPFLSKVKESVLMQSQFSTLCLRLTLGVVASFLVLAQQPCSAQLDETWTVEVNGQTVTVDANGRFFVPNVAAADQFGPGGPGSAPDFLSDDFLRLTGVGLIHGVPHYALSDFFQVAQGQVFSVGQLFITDQPPPSVELLQLTAELVTLTELGLSSQLTALATLGDGSVLDVTPRTSFSVYRTSNPSVATVSSDGLVTAVGPGPVLITVVNDGVTAVSLLQVSPGASTTTVVGFVQFQDGSPASGATVSVIGQPTGAMSAADGSFTIVDVLAEEPEIMVAATLGSEAGVSGLLIPIADGFTDSGIVTLAPTSALPLENGGFESGTFAGFIAQGNATVVPSLGALLPPEGNLMAQLSTGPSGTIGRLTAPVEIPAAAQTFDFEFNFLTNEINQGASFNDFFLARLVLPDGTSLELVRVSRNDLLSGNFPNLPGDGGFQAQTGFLSASADISAFAGSMMIMDFCFLVQDVGDTIVDSAVLLDDLRFGTQ
jgi:hypothetical protein